MNDEETQEIIQARNWGTKKDIRIRESNGMLMQESRMYVPNNMELKKAILDEAHISAYAMHPGSTQMYHTIQPFYYWPGMKREIVEYIVKYHRIPFSIISDRDPRFTSQFWIAFQKALGSRLFYSTTYHPQTDGQSKRTILTLEDMLRSSVLQFGDTWHKRLNLMEFAYNNNFHSSIGMSHFEAFYGKSCRTPLCWLEVDERVLVGPEIVEETTPNIQVIKSNLKEAQDRQKSLADRHATDRMYNLSPWKCVGRFGKKCKLSPRYIGPYMITERVGEVAYRLDMPSELSKVHDVFHVFMLRHYISDPSHMIPPQPLEINSNLTYDEEPMTILDWKDKVLRNKTVRLVKVLWRNHSVEEAT
ncbi:unnamed protein product [Malus baccata var. baccata]